MYVCIYVCMYVCICVCSFNFFQVVGQHLWAMLCTCCVSSSLWMNADLLTCVLGSVCHFHHLTHTDLKPENILLEDHSLFTDEVRSAESIESYDHLRAFIYIYIYLLLLWTFSLCIPCIFPLISLSLIIIFMPLACSRPFLTLCYSSFIRLTPTHSSRSSGWFTHAFR